MEDAFREAFEKTDSLYIKRLNEDGLEKMKASGTTALCALIEDNKNVYLAWAGDSQVCLMMIFNISLFSTSSWLMIVIFSFLGCFSS